MAGSVVAQRSAAHQSRRIRAVTFDCWNTLILDRNLEAARDLRVAALVEAAGARGVRVAPDTALAAIRAAHGRHVQLWSRGVGTGSHEMAAWALEALGVSDAPLARELGGRFEEAGLAGEVETLPDAAATLEALAARGVRLALVCDTGFSGGRIVRRFLERVGLLARLEVLVFSDEVGVPKPHPRMFAAALGPLGVAPAESIHVGDLRPTDVAGGRAFGMGTVRLRAAFDDRSEHPEADVVADSHDALAELLLESC
jgi:putative hydrolase of the HAD superfamily